MLLFYKFWMYFVAVIVVFCSSPFFLLYLIGNLTTLGSKFFIDVFADNLLSKFLIRKVEQHMQTPAITEVEE